MNIHSIQIFAHYFGIPIEFLHLNIRLMFVHKMVAGEVSSLCYHLSTPVEY